MKGTIDLDAFLIPFDYVLTQLVNIIKDHISLNKLLFYQFQLLYLKTLEDAPKFSTKRQLGKSISWQFYISY